MIWSPHWLNKDGPAALCFKFRQQKLLEYGYRLSSLYAQYPPDLLLRLLVAVYTVKVS